MASTETSAEDEHHDAPVGSALPAWGLIALILVVLVAATALFGYPGLIICALAMVALSFAAMLIISRG